MELPGQKLEEYEDDKHDGILSLMEEVKEKSEEKVLKIKTRKHGWTIYAGYLYDMDTDREMVKTDEEELWMVYNPENDFQKTSFYSGNALHNTLLKEKSAEVVDVQEVKDNKLADIFEERLSWSNALDQCYVVVKSTDDGRYKDQLKYYYGDTVDEAFEDVGSEDSKYERISIGTMREVLEEDVGSDREFNFKKSNFKSVRLDLRALCPDSPADKIRDKLSGSDESWV